MTNYRIFKAIQVSSGSTGFVSASSTVWGIMKGDAGSSGSLEVLGGGIIKIEHLQQGAPIPCYFRSVSVTAGSVYILA